jgi:hypothetical protein
LLLFSIEVQHSFSINLRMHQLLFDLHIIDWSGFISAAGNLWCSRGGSSVTGADSTDWNRSFVVEARLRPSLYSGPSNFREESPYNDSHRKNPTQVFPL